MTPVAEMTEGASPLDIHAERTGRQVERDFALVNLRRVTVGTALVAAALVGMISMGLAGQAAANVRPLALPLPVPTAAVVVVRLPVAVIVRVPVPVYVGGGSTMTSSRRASSGSAPPQAAAPVQAAPASPGATAAPKPPTTPPPAPVCTSSPSLCPK